MSEARENPAPQRKPDSQIPAGPQTPARTSAGRGQPAIVEGWLLTFLMVLLALLIVLTTGCRSAAAVLTDPPSVVSAANAVPAVVLPARADRAVIHHPPNRPNPADHRQHLVVAGEKVKHFLERLTITLVVLTAPLDLVLLTTYVRRHHRRFPRVALCTVALSVAAGLIVLAWIVDHFLLPWILCSAGATHLVGWIVERPVVWARYLR